MVLALITALPLAGTETAVMVAPGPKVSLASTSMLTSVSSVAGTLRSSNASTTAATTTVTVAVSVSPAAVVTV